MTERQDDPEGEEAERLDRVIDDVLRTSRSLIDQLESLLERARALLKENKRLLAERKKPSGEGPPED